MTSNEHKKRLSESRSQRIGYDRGRRHAVAGGAHNPTVDPAEWAKTRYTLFVPAAAAMRPGGPLVVQVALHQVASVALSTLQS